MSLLYYALSYALSRLKRGWMHAVLLVAVYGALIALSMAFSSEENNVDYAGVGLLTRFFPVYVMGVYAHRMKAAFDRARHNDWCVTAAIVVFALTFYCTGYPHAHRAHRLPGRRHRRGARRLGLGACHDSGALLLPRRDLL